MSKEAQSPLIPLMAIRGITQRDIAKALEVNEQTVSNWMTGRTEAKLTLADWRKLANVLHCSLDQLPDSLAPQPIHDVSSSNHA